MAGKVAGHRPRIGFFISEFGAYQEPVLTGATAYAQREKVTLFCFPGGDVTEVQTQFKTNNGIYQLATPENLDGIILLTGTLFNGVSIEDTLRFCSNFMSLPLVSAGLTLPGMPDVPSVVIDNASGLRALMKHLIEDHHYTRIAFIRGPEGNEDADMRYVVYREALDTYQIPYDPSLVAIGNFLTESAVQGIATLLDERKVSFQVVVASNDNMALGAMNELMQRGYRVPRDIAVTGFDDTHEAGTSVVPLTTVRQTLSEIGEQSVDLMLEYIRNGKVPVPRALPTKMVLRESCGCASPITGNVIAYKLPTTGAFTNQERDEVLTLIESRILDNFPSINPRSLQELVDTFIEEVEGKSDRFIRLFTSLLWELTAQAKENLVVNHSFDAWQDVVSILRSRVYPRLAAKVSPEHVDDLLHQSRAIIAEFITRSALNVAFIVGTQTLQQNSVVRRLGATTTVAQVADVLAEGLPQLNISNGYVILNSEHIGKQGELWKEGELILAFEPGKRYDLGTEGRHVILKDLIPAEVAPAEMPPAFVVRTLWTGDMQMGFIIMSMQTGLRTLYEKYFELSRHITTALRSVLLMRQIAESNERLADHANELMQANERLEALNIELEIAQRRAEQSSNAKSIFLSNMSHELRTPLNVIIGYSNSMLNMPQMFGKTPLPETYRQYVQLIEENGHYLVGLINDILDLSKIEVGRLELHYTAVNLTDILRGVMSTTVGLVKDKPVQIRPDFPDDLPLVWADHKRIRQILLNLMSNAVKFTDSGSITLHAHHENGTVQIAVSDTGIGIPEDVIAIIFDRFQQAQFDTQHKYGGTGLGLDISKQLCQMQGGDLIVESSVGKGSTFRFSLPVATPEQIGTPQAPIHSEAHETAVMLLDTEQFDDSNRHTILIIEDEVSMRDMMRQLLESKGHVVLDTHDGAQGIELAVGMLPELIILDIFLPNMDGWEVLQELRKMPETAATPIIVCTVAPDNQKAIDMGATYYLEKPFTTDQILQLVQQVFASDVKLSE